MSPSPATGPSAELIRYAHGSTRIGRTCTPCVTHVASDPRVGPSAMPGWDWVGGVHARQLQQLARRNQRDGTPG
ncbi:hypothetical protein [Arthrobacter sp. Bi83]|uniref:hypothetical protein n=1 Tax=Arthrobacter sp. Bi83 TaxID=2822353 RepID=UPI001E3BC43D|nr:hypothetical protein [Arthrobacter sp. Bi83]